jgi:predicted transcriptional regulator
MFSVACKIQKRHYVPNGIEPYTNGVSVDHSDVHGRESVTGDSVVRYVANSSVRTDVLLAVSDRALDTDGLIERVDASESAVYNALTALERGELIVSADHGWTPTGSGRLVATALADQRALGTLLEDEYWQRHDVSPLPHRYRTTIGALAGCRVARTSDTDPYSLVRELSAIVESSETPDIVSPIYQPEYARSMPDSPGARLVLDRSVIEEVLRGPEDVEVRDFEETSVRVMDVALSLCITESDLILSLPKLDGSYDARASVVADHESAIEWGGELFEQFWRRATPIDDVFDLDHL